MTKENETCPKCKEGIMKLRNGKFGQFLACNAYPDCDYTEQVKGKAQAKPEIDTQRIIVRQNSIGNAIKFLEKVDDCPMQLLLETAQAFENWVLR